MRSIRWLVLSLCVLLPAAANGPRPPSYRLDRWTPADGLPAWQIRDLLQSPDGYLWIATPAGLVRFDGDHFHVITRASDPEMGTNRVQGISLVGGGELWFGGSDFLLRLDAAGRVSPVAEVHGLVHAVARDRAGRTWIFSDDGRLGYLEAGRIVEAPEGSCEGFRVDRDGTLWIRKSDGTIENVDGDRREPSTVRQVVPAEPFWVLRRQILGAPGTGRPLDTRVAGDVVAVRTEQGGLIATFPNAADAVPWIVDRRGQLWIGRAGAVEAYRGDSGRPLFHQDLGSDNLVSEILEDNEGNLWIGTRARGLFRLRPSFIETYGAPGAVLFRAFTTDSDGSLLVESSTGLHHVERGPLRPYLTEEGRRAERRHVDLHGTVWHVIDGHLVGTTPRGRAVDLEVDPSAHFTNLPGDPDAFWMDAPDGLYRIEPDAAAGAHVERRFADAIRRATVTHVDRRGRLWVADRERVHRIDDGRLETLDLPEELDRIDVRAFLEDPDETMWMGTASAGLVRLRDGRSRNVGTASGLAEDGVFALLGDARGRFWMSGNRGIHAADRTEIEAVLDGTADRIRGVHFASESGTFNPEDRGALGAVDRRGFLWFSSYDGIDRVDSDLADALTASPPIVHIEAAADDERQLALDPNAGVVLRPGRRRIDVEFTGISLRDPRLVRFESKLEPLDAGWVNLGQDRHVRYANLAPGRYSLRIRAWSAGGVPSAEDAVLPIDVRPRFRETFAFRALVSFALVLAAFGVYRMRVRGIRRRAIELDREVRRRTEDLERTNRLVREQARKLSELDVAKSRFFANVSHEFRTPLTLILGPLEDVAGGMHGEVGENVRRQLALASENAHRLLRMVNQLLDTARIEAGRLRLRAREEDVGAMLRRMADLFASPAERKGIEFAVSVPSDLPRAWIDEEQLEKVVVNLLGNAFKFTPPGGRVEMDAARDGDVLRIRVRDTGPGIADADLPRVFERFYQSGGRGPSSQPGTGIGLALARDLVELHHGVISVRSHLGEGSTFEVRLPLGGGHLAEDEKAPPDAGPMERRLRRAAIEDRSRRIVLDDATATEAPPVAAGESEDLTTVLVVEDNLEMRAYLRRHLERRYRVTEAGGGQEAMEAIASRVPDLIVSDLMMPGMDGLELCRRVKEDPELDFVPVVLLTAKASVTSRLEGWKTGADDYLAKPVDPEELLVRVENLLQARRRLLRRLAEGGTALPAPAPESGSADSALVRAVLEVVDRRLDDETFDVDALARELGQSRRTLYRKLEEEGLTPSGLILGHRLDRAAALLASGEGNVSEVAYAVGFRSVSHFSRRFRERHGTSPSHVRLRSGPRKDATPRSD